MKRWSIFLLWALVSSGAGAETVLICHAQSIPSAGSALNRSSLATSLADGVFDYYFARGDIAFEQAFSLVDGVPSSSWLGALSSRYGADKVVYFQVIWKQNDTKQIVLDRVDWQVVTTRGQVLTDGSLSAPLPLNARDDSLGVRDLTDRVVARLSS